MTPARKRVKRAPKKTTKIKRQTVAGFVVFRRTEEGIKYLLLYRRGMYWNFPKGKFEEGENDLQAALRETWEETGLQESDLKMMDGFKTKLRYSFRIGEERIYDTVILHLAETDKALVTIAEREHSGYAWFLYPDAMKTIGSMYQGTKRVLKQAHEFLKNPEGGMPKISEPKRKKRPRKRSKKKYTKPRYNQKKKSTATKKVSHDTKKQSS